MISYRPKNEISRRDYEICIIKEMDELDVKLKAICKAVDAAVVDELFKSNEDGAMATTIHGALHVYTHFNDRSMVLHHNDKIYRITHVECSVVDILTKALAKRFPCKCEICKK